MSGRENNRRFNRNGSITVAVAFLLPAMILMLVLVVNINQLIFSKIKLQNTVDACALSAAAVQAAGLNEIADLNREMAMEHQNLATFLQSGTWHSYASASRARDYFFNETTGVIDWIYRYQTNANRRYAELADQVAQNVKNLNMPQSRLETFQSTDRLTGLSKISKNSRFRYYTQSFSKGPPVATVGWNNPGNPRYSGDHDGRNWIVARRTAPVPGFFSNLERVEKTSPTFAAYEILLPAENFLLAESIFGSMPVLRARAVAIPAGGHIKEGRPTYEAVLVR